MRNRVRAGLLPLYLALYDERLPQMRVVLEPFLTQVASGLEKNGVEVVAAPVCRIAGEFENAIKRFEAEGAQCIVTLHLAYSPSLESLDALTHTALPIVVLDTTMDHDFGSTVDPERILYNHGIHGVQDMASMLRRRGKDFAIVAGHYKESDVLDRAAAMVHAAAAARNLRKTRVLRIGKPFEGMGDFAVPDHILEEVLGIQVKELGIPDLVDAAADITGARVEEEMGRDRERFNVTARKKCHRRSVRVGLSLRKLLEEGSFCAFSMNFLAFDSDKEPIDTVPFLEASKAMERGTGYAGEGDALTASLVGALASAFGETTFTEIFCPDWKGNSLFLSHMGEINPALAAEVPLLCERPFPFTAAKNPAILTCAPRPGPAVLVNLAPGPQVEDQFSLIVAPVEVEDTGGGQRESQHPGMRDQIRAWVRPAVPVDRFLEEYSKFGGTHHSALVLDVSVEALRTFALFAGLDFHVI